MNPDDTKLSALLRETRESPPLPPRFRENVWRRIEDVEAPVKPESWLDAFVVLLWRPRFAFAAAAVLISSGVFLGVHESAQSARHDAQERYVAYVAPNPLR